MGKRRSRKAPQKKAASKLPTQFDCPFCNHQSTIHVKVHYASGVGSLECRVCAVKADTRITHLSKEIDVYCEWMDSCVELNKQDDDNPLEETQDQGPKKRQRLKVRQKLSITVYQLICLYYSTTMSFFVDRREDFQNGSFFFSTSYNLF